MAGRRNPAHLPADLRAVRLDVREPDLAGLEPTVAVFCATPDERSERAYRALYVDGLQSLLAVLPSQCRVLFVSSTAVYGAAAETLDEQSACEPEAFNGELLLIAERLLASVRPLGRYLNARLGGIYGPGRVALIDRVRRADGCSGSPVHFTNRIHVEDAARALAFLITREDWPAVANVVDCASAAECEVMAYIAQRLGVPKPQPRAHSRGIGKQVQPRVLADLGFIWHYPTYREGYGALLDCGGTA